MKRDLLKSQGGQELIEGGVQEENFIGRGDCAEENSRRTTSCAPPQASVGSGEPFLVSRSPSIAAISEMIGRIAGSVAPVLITGESGTGKEVVARMIHARSQRAGRPFVAVNCAALPKDVIENELFGHEREAFTGASSKKPGCFELANHATLFLDEVAEMHPASQAKLLRVLESKTFRRLGGNEEIEADTRVIAATNKEIPDALKSGQLREDLYYRLGVIEIALPPLRERPDDVPLLADHFLSHYCDSYGKPRKRFSKECMDALVEFHWPGNVRELKNLVESLTLVCPDAVIRPDHLRSRLASTEPAHAFIRIPLGTPMEEAKTIIVAQTLASVGNNKSRAAKILGMSRKTLYDGLRRSGS